MTLLISLLLVIPLPRGICKDPSSLFVISPLHTDEEKLEGPALVIRVLLQEYLDHLLPAKMQKDFVITGHLKTMKGRPHLKLDLVDNTSQEKRLTLEGELNYPDTLNQLLTDVTQKIATAMGKKVKVEKLLPYLNTSRSAASYEAYARGTLSLSSSREATAALAKSTTIDKAIGLFQKAVEADYNYVPAYIGLAEALTAKAALICGVEGGALAVRARIELEKAKLLIPHQAEERSERLEREWKKLQKEKCA